MLLVAFDFDIDIEVRKRAALSLAAYVGTSKLGDFFVRYEPYSEWIALGIAAATFGILKVEEMVNAWLRPPQSQTASNPSEEIKTAEATVRDVPKDDGSIDQPRTE